MYPLILKPLRHMGGTKCLSDVWLGLQYGAAGL